MSEPLRLRALWPNRVTSVCSSLRWDLKTRHFRLLVYKISRNRMASDMDRKSSLTGFITKGIMAPKIQQQHGSLESGPVSLDLCVTTYLPRIFPTTASCC